jgi:hypothetical protein
MARTDPRPNYGSKRRVHVSGYIDLYRPGHPLAKSDGYVFEHRLVAWEAGILTDPAQHVHHVNHDKQDNRPENLEAKDPGEHVRDHAEEAGMVRNQWGLFPVKPRGQRGSDLFPSQGGSRPERPCRVCGETIPLTKRRDAIYCSSNCRVKAWKKTVEGAPEVAGADPRPAHVGPAAEG